MFLIKDFYPSQPVSQSSMKFVDFVSIDTKGAELSARPIPKKHAIAIGTTLCLAAALSFILPSEAQPIGGRTQHAARLPADVSGTLNLVDGSIEITEDSTLQQNAAAEAVTTEAEEILSASVPAEDLTESTAPAPEALASTLVPPVKRSTEETAVPLVKNAEETPSPREERIEELKADVHKMLQPEATFTETLIAKNKARFESTDNQQVDVAKEPMALDNYDDVLSESELADADSSMKAEIYKLAKESGKADGSPVQAKWYVENISKGDTLSSVFTDLNIPYATMQAITSSREAGYKLSSLKPGNTLSFLIDDNNKLVAFVKQLDKKEQLRFYREDTSKLDFIAVREPLGAHLQSGSSTAEDTKAILGGSSSIALQKKPESAERNPADISNDVPLYQRRGRLVVVNIEKGQAFSTAALASGLTYSEIDQILRLFKGRIQFSRHIQPGDSMRVLFSDSKGKGKINAVEFNLKRLGKIATFRNLADNKYYDENGYNSSSGTFRRFPLDGKVRISSNFNPNRRHPVTGKVRPHNGTDFAVKVGTPVIAPADGVVEKASYSRSAGYYIVLSHRGSYSTVYMHLSKLNVKPGQRVKIGSVIARSGNTGLSTGPHLHYELRRNGRPVNAMRVNLPMNEDSAVAQKQRQRFANNVQLYKKELYQDNLIAKL